MEEIKYNDQFTDSEIIHRICAGETKLYEIIIRRCNSALYKIGRAYRFSHHDTEDLMQETYIVAFSNLHKFENRSSFKTWITRIMLNHCFHKKQKFSFIHETTTENMQPDNSVPMFQQPDNADKNITNKELGRVLEKALTAIPDDYRMVFTLRELNGLSVSETTEALQITESNVKVRLNRAKRLLRSEIEKLYSPEDIFEFNLIYCDRMVQNVMSRISNDKTESGA